MISMGPDLRSRDHTCSCRSMAGPACSLPESAQESLRLANDVSHVSTITYTRRATSAKPSFCATRCEAKLSSPVLQTNKRYVHGTVHRVLRRHRGCLVHQSGALSFCVCFSHERIPYERAEICWIHCSMVSQNPGAKRSPPSSRMP